MYFEVKYLLCVKYCVLAGRAFSAPLHSKRSDVHANRNVHASHLRASPRGMGVSVCLRVPIALAAARGVYVCIVGIFGPKEAPSVVPRLHSFSHQPPIQIRWIPKINFQLG